MHNYSVSLSTKRLKNSLLLINTQHYSSRSQYGGRHRLSRLSSILRATHPQQTLTFRRTGKVEIRRLCMQITRSRDCARVVCNLRILRMRNTISRLRKFSDCAEQIHHFKCTDAIDFFAHETVSHTIASSYRMAWTMSSAHETVSHTIASSLHTRLSHTRC